MLASVFKGAGWALAAGLGAVVGVVWHRSQVNLGPLHGFPVGLVVGLVLVLSVAVTARAVGGWPGWIGAAIGTFLVCQGAALPGPGGDLLVHGDWAGVIWVVGAPLFTLVAVLLPRRWFWSS
jgi:hypothetical protein